MSVFLSYLNKKIDETEILKRERIKNFGFPKGDNYLQLTLGYLNALYDIKEEYLKQMEID